MKAHTPRLDTPSEAFNKDVDAWQKRKDADQREQAAFDNLERALHDYAFWRKASESARMIERATSSTFAHTVSDNLSQGKMVLACSLEKWVQKMLKSIDVSDLDDDEARLFGMLMTTDKNGKLLSYEAIGEIEGCSAPAIMRRKDKLTSKHKAISCFIDKHAPRKERGKRNKTTSNPKK
jgi:hypothetical protein